MIKQFLPDRLADFVRHYEKPKPRKDISYDSYRIEDYLQGLTVTRGYDKEKVVGPDAAVQDGGLSPLQTVFLASRAGTIYGGSNEVQRNIIAERFWGLPRDRA